MSIVGFGALWSILLILAGGWLALRARSLEPIIWSESGYNLYFKIAAAGLLWFLICATAFTSLGFSSVVALSCPGGHHGASPGVAAFFQFFYRCNGEIFMVASWATPFVGLLVFVLFSRFPRLTRLIINWRLKNIFREKEFEKIIWHAIGGNNALLVTLDNSKAYIGWPADTFDFSQSDTAKKYLRIIPMMSGYRDSTAMNLTITTDYSAALEKYRKLLALVIPVEKSPPCKTSTSTCTILFNAKTHPPRNLSHHHDLHRPDPRPGLRLRVSRFGQRCPTAGFR